MIWKVVRRPAWATFHIISRLYQVLSRREYRYVFILGHMRSGSTLLAHILASHPDFVGAGETHISYQTPADLPKLVVKTCELLHRPILRGPYVVDQINHPYVTDDVLHSERLYKCVILVREPEATLKSLMNMLKCDETEALEAYSSRLRLLIRHGMVLKKRAILVEYDDLVDNTEKTLDALTRFFDLETPLTPTYSTHRMTGRVSGFGDPSINIATGQIIRTQRHDITVSRETLVTATQAFQNCRQQLETITANAKARSGLPRALKHRP